MVVPLNASTPNSGRPFRFTRQFRLKSPLVIRQILRDGQAARRRFSAFRVISGRRTSGNLPSFAFVVSRDAGPAVTRNRIKRRLREAVRLQRAFWPTHPVGVVFRVNNDDAASMEFEVLKDDVRQALKFADGAADVRITNA